MKKLIIISSITVFFLYSCVSNTKYEEMKIRLDSLTVRMDSLEKDPFRIAYPDINKEDLTRNYQWFNLGEDLHQIVDKHFYVSSITTSYKENGFQIKGIIGNVCSMNINNAIIECAIKDSTKQTKLNIGFSDVPYLYSGAKVNFSVFVPTGQTKVSEIGVLIRDYRL